MPKIIMLITSADLLIWFMVMFVLNKLNLLTGVKKNLKNVLLCSGVTLIVLFLGYLLILN